MGPLGRRGRQDLDPVEVQLRDAGRQQIGEGADSGTRCRPLDAAGLLTALLGRDGTTASVAQLDSDQVRGVHIHRLEDRSLAGATARCSHAVEVDGPDLAQRGPGVVVAAGAGWCRMVRRRSVGLIGQAGPSSPGEPTRRSSGCHLTCRNAVPSVIAGRPLLLGFRSGPRGPQQACSDSLGVQRWPHRSHPRAHQPRRRGEPVGPPRSHRDGPRVAAGGGTSTGRRSARST